MIPSNFASIEDASTQGTSGYLRRLRERRKGLAVEKRATFGAVFGTIFLLLGGYLHFFVAKGGWLPPVLLGVGAFLLLAGFLAPLLIAPVEKLVLGATQYLGKAIMWTLLTLTYFVFVFPVGCIQRMTKGSDPFFSWGTKESTNDMGLEGWQDKVSEADKAEVQEDAKSKHLLLQPFGILQYFIENKQFIFIPLILLLVLLGLILFFAQSSALAPLIYTLF